VVRLGAVVPATAGGGWEAGPATVGSAACNACNHGQRGLQPWAAERGLQPRVISRPRGAVLTTFVRTAFDLPSAYIGLYRLSYLPHTSTTSTRRVTMSERTAFPTHYSLSTTDYSLLNTYYLQPATYYSLLTAYRLPPTTHYLLPTAYHLLLTTYYLLPTTYYVLLPATYHVLPLPLAKPTR
jgi:hypothetical protein